MSLSGDLFLPQAVGEHLFQAWPDPVLVIDEDTNILACNAPALALQPGSGSNTSLYGWLTSATSLHQALAERLTEPDSVLALSLTFKQSASPLEARLIRLPAETSVPSFLLVCRQSSAFAEQELELQRLNQELSQRASQLSNSNRELERFAYIASHDLQEPLRMVSSFLQLLKRKYDSQLDETAQKYIHFAVDGAERMKRLIEDLLMYSRLTNSQEEPVPVSLAETMTQVRQLLRVQIRETQAQIQCQPMPTVMGNPTQLEQLMQNLLSNALKYHAPERPLQIEISARRQDQDWVISIQDNGIGIEEQFFQKIFVIFQRLHTKSEYSGTGIGLALCSKIVERHGGQIWVQSQMGHGSCFCFSLPVIPEHTLLVPAGSEP